MGWRFRRSFKIAPGLRVNLSRRSLGLSAGPRGAKVSANTRGEIRRTAGLPGTGLSHTTQTRLRPGYERDEVLSDELTTGRLEHLRRRRLLKLTGWGSAALILVLIFAGAPTVAGYLIVPAVVLTIIAPWFARFL
jgi:hypothetical protein